MQVNIVNTDNSTTIRLQGRFDFNTHRDFRAAVDTALKGLQSLISIDFGGVDYLDSSALGMLLMLRDKAGAASKTVSLINCGGGVRQILDIANFSKLFSIS
ncbi:MAG: STAS domain-containing protein [Betaproteobacteria bacterium]|nr:STAS domain-containing protein [Betaproteobacteria bacterium]